jgi:hypothetical protein
MLKVFQQLPNSDIGEIVIANLESFKGLTRTKLMDDLFSISGWNTDFLPAIDGIDMIRDRIQRKKANYLAVLCSDRSHASSLLDLLKQLRDEFPELTIFVHGSEACIVEKTELNHLLISRNLSELILNMKQFFANEVVL